jgi:hypothetical protein
MAWSDRFLNPTWHKISRLDAQRAYEISLIVLLPGFLRMMLRERLVARFEQLGDPNTPANILEGSFGPFFREARKFWPMRPELRERLIDESLLGLFACTEGTLTAHLSINVSSLFLEAAGVLALAEINHRLGRSEPVVLTKIGYSGHPDECRVQVILKWMRLVGIQHPEFPRFLSSLYFAEEWKRLLNVDDLLRGMSIAHERVGRDEFLERARQECAKLSPQGIAIVSHICERLTKQQPNDHSGTQRHPNVRPLSLLDKVSEISNWLLREADARGWKANPELPRIMGEEPDVWRREEATVAAFMIVSISVLMEGGRVERAFSLEKLKWQLVNRRFDQEITMMDELLRRNGFTPKPSREADVKLKDSIHNIYALYAEYAKECATSPFSLRKLYDKLGCGFGYGVDIALTNPFEPVVLPIIGRLRRELAASS